MQLHGEWTHFDGEEEVEEHTGNPEKGSKGFERRERWRNKRFVQHGKLCFPSSAFLLRHIAEGSFTCLGPHILTTPGFRRQVH